MSHETGNLSINSENILPIIKKWLYSDTDIFLRELVSNSADAITKLQKLVSMGLEDVQISADEKYKINVVLDEENKIIQIIDNGLGMTADEIKQYINQIAFSGAVDFLEKYKDKLDKENEIIGHFGLGFYSAFMVADKVQIETLSYKKDAVSAKWISDGGIQYEMEEGTRGARGTTITLFVGESGKDFLNEYKLKSILKKYCSFIPVEIFFETVKNEEVKDADEVVETEEQEQIVDEVKPINDTNPLWLKQPKDCTDEEYKEFYQKVFSDFNEPLFWIHLNMDYPFRLKGILYFPKLKHELETAEGQVKLYSNQVFIADNIKEVIPEFLLLLKGTIDCPDIPLNVSRSFLQNDGYVSKMSGYITKKVADKLNSLYKNEKENFIKFWDDINLFIKYGCIKDRSFYDKVKDTLLYKTTSDDYVTLNEYLERNKEKHENKIFYVSNEKQQAQYIKLFKEQEMEAVILSSSLDNPFISYLENYESGKTFTRIDSDLSDSLKNKEEESSPEINEQLQSLFSGVLKNEKVKIKTETLKSDSVPAIILLSEQSRRMQEMSKMFGSMNMPNMFENEETLVLNKNNNLVKSLISIKDDEAKKEDVELICEQLYDLAMMSHKPLEANEMTKFIERTTKLLERLI